MDIFGALVRTVVNVAVLPVTLPVAVVKDVVQSMEGDRIGDNTKRLVKEIKDDASERK